MLDPVNKTEGHDCICESPFRSLKSGIFPEVVIEANNISSEPKKNIFYGEICSA